MQGMQYDIDEVLTQSIMTNMPSVLVEGVDDIGVYDKILNFNSKIAEVIAIETVEGYAKGCDSVINATVYLENKNSAQYNYIDYLVGIIDKDVRDYRNELPENPLTEALKIKLMDSIVESMELLYIASLEALKGALISDYNSEFGYCQNYGRLKDNPLAIKLYEKKSELEDFALTLSLTRNLETLKKICKGKWLLGVFCEQLEKLIKNLPEQCGTDPVKSCQMCISRAENSCLYRLMEGLSHKSMRSIAQRVTTSPELEYIRERVSSMHSKVA